RHPRRIFPAWRGCRYSRDCLFRAALGPGALFNTRRAGAEHDHRTQSPARPLCRVQLTGLFLAAIAPSDDVVDVEIEQVLGELVAIAHFADARVIIGVGLPTLHGPKRHRIWQDIAFSDELGGMFKNAAI